MPTYDFGCTNDECGFVFEAAYTIKDAPSQLQCEHCGATANRLISAPFVQSDAPLWINGHLRDHIQNDGERPIETRKELSDYCKAKNIVPCS